MVSPRAGTAGLLSSAEKVAYRNPSSTYIYLSPLQIATHSCILADMSDRISEMSCTVAYSLTVVGERWALLILRDAMYGIRRFDEFQESLGIARNILADRLEKLVAHGVMERRQYQERPARHEYVLTPKGRDLFPVLMTLMRWGDTWGHFDELPKTTTHLACGSSDVHAATVCSACGEAMTLRDTIVEPLPEIVRARLASSGAG